MWGLKNSSWKCPPRKNSAEILGCTLPLVSPDVAVGGKKQTPLLTLVGKIQCGA